MMCIFCTCIEMHVPEMEEDEPLEDDQPEVDVVDPPNPHTSEAAAKRASIQKRNELVARFE